MVLCHGGPGLSDNLGPVAELVEDLARVHRFDQRGAGRSRSDGPFDIAAFVADLEALRRHWGHDRWVVGGHSWGANLALFFALAHPARTRGVIYLAGTGLRWGWQEDARRRRLARLSEAERRELSALEPRAEAGELEAAERLARLMWSTDLADRTRTALREDLPLYRFPRDAAVFRAATRSYRQTLDAGVVDGVRALQAPVLVIHGAHDTDPARAREVAALAPNGRYVELADSGHSPWLEEPLALGRALRGFLAELP